MKTSVLSNLSVLLCAGALGACSLINSFDELKDVADGSGGSGLGGDLNNSGGGSMGGAGSGGTGSVEPAEPGLVVIAVDPDNNTATTDDRMAVVLDPHSGAEYETLAGNFEAIEHEAERDVWFFVAGSKLTARSFDRDARSFKEEGSLALAFKSDLTFAYALSNRLYLLDQSRVFHVYDTTDLTKITELTPNTPMPDGTIWDGVGVSSNNLRSVFLLGTKCKGMDTECEAYIWRLDPTKLGDAPTEFPLGPITGTGVPNDDMPYSAKTGSIAFDSGTTRLLAYVPTYVSTITTGDVFRIGPQLIGIPDTFKVKEFGPQVGLLAIDSCQQVLFAKDKAVGPVSIAGITDIANPVFSQENVSMSGQGMQFEPYTHSLILIQQSGTISGVIAAYESRGTPDNPDLVQRVADWSPAVEGSPYLIRVAAPVGAVCQ